MPPRAAAEVAFEASVVVPPAGAEALPAGALAEAAGALAELEPAGATALVAAGAELAELAELVEELEELLDPHALTTRASTASPAMAPDLLSALREVTTRTSSS